MLSDLFVKCKEQAALFGKAIHYTLKSLFREPAGVEVKSKPTGQRAKRR